MTNSTNTKRALLTSIVAMLLCFSMLLGTTFAWFTDEAVSTNNKIVAGTLDIALFQIKAGEEIEITDTSAPVFGADIVWAPGHEAAVDLKLKNIGNIALEWKLKIVPIEEVGDLAEVINVYLLKDNRKIFISTLADIWESNLTITSGEMNNQGETESFSIVLEMQEIAGNEYQGKSAGAFDIKVIAEQSSRVRVKNLEELDGAIKNGDAILIVSDIKTPENTDTLLYAPAGKPLDVDGNGSTIITKGIGTEPGVSHDYGYVGFIPANGENATVRDLKVTGAGFVEVGHHGESMFGNYIIDKLVIENLAATLWIYEGKYGSFPGNPIAPAFTPYGYTVMTDCVMTGTTALHDGYKPYDAAFVNNTQTTIYGGQYGTIYLSAHAMVTVEEGAVIGEIDSCAHTKSSNGKLIISAGAKVGTINLIPLDSLKPDLVIEEGAEVGKIVYDGTEYTVAEWMAR